MNEIVHSYTASQMALIRKTVAQDCNHDEFDLFIEICKQYGLSPFKKQIYAQVYNKDKADKRKMVIVTSVDGYRAIAQRCGDYRPAEDETKFEIDESLKNPDSNPIGLVRAVVKVFKYGADKVWYPVVGEARWDEFAPLDEGFDLVDKGEKWPDGNSKKTRVPNGKVTLKTGNWKTMPHVMLSKCAEVQALRRGWPEVMGGLYVQEEMEKVYIDMTATEAADAHEREERLKRVSGQGTIPIILESSEGLQLIPVGKFADRVLDFAGQFDNKSMLDFWQDQNKMGLKQFWAEQPSDALKLKKDLEKLDEKLKKLEALK